MEATQVGYEAGLLPPGATLLEHTRQALHDTMLYAMRGLRATVPHVEHRVRGDVVAPCPVGEAVAEAMHKHVVGDLLLRVLRYSHCPDVIGLRETIASAYADEQAPLIAALGEKS